MPFILRLQGEVSEGKDVVVWGCGPVGLLVQVIILDYLKWINV
jgi:threonine dehydrogenase-like Zn-dependent dehydrogenase